MIRSLHHVGIAVPDLEVGRSFYETFGLEAIPQSDRLTMRCVGRAQDQVVLLEAPQKRLHHLSFGTSAAELPVMRARLEAAGTQMVEPPYDDGSDGIWFHDPDGTLVNLRIAESAPIQPGPVPLVNSPGSYSRFAQAGCPSKDLKAMPRKLGHLIKFTTDVNRSLDFYTRHLGMKLTDRSGNFVAFLRCGNGGDHHVLGLLQSEKPGLHHLSFEVGSIDELGMGAKQMIDAGYRHVWGLGRHIGGSNFFQYFRDPWNSMAEYYWDIDIIPDGAHWEPIDVPPKDIMFLWAPTAPPEDFGKNYEA
jgi:catechol 2,3-dioxygenase-like lactoylglutathione lyase family enzyme